MDLLGWFDEPPALQSVHNAAAQPIHSLPPLSLILHSLPFTFIAAVKRLPNPVAVWGAL